MKKFFAIFALLVLCSISAMPVYAFANSAQLYFEGVTSTGALVNEENCPIEVTAENLTFNIVDYPHVYDENPSYNSNVIAEYTFYNPKDYDVNMQLVFPFGVVPYWIRDDYVDIDKYGAYVNGEKVERSIRGIYVDRYEDYVFNLDRDLAKLSDTRKSFGTFDDDTIVYKYSMQISFNNTYSNNYRPYAQFETYGLSLILPSDVSYSTYSQSGYCAKVYSDGQMDIYSIGEQLPDNFFAASYYAEGREEIDGVYTYVTKTISGSITYQYLGEITFEDLMFTYYNEDSGINRTDYYNAIVDKISAKQFNNKANDLSAFNLTNELLLWYQYDVSVPAMQTVTNKVVAPLYPNIDEHYEPTMYSYEYLLSPASSWASFSNLDIVINTQSYMLNCSLKGFVKNVNGYEAHFNTLPNGELTFELCESPNPSKPQENFIVFLILLFLVIIPLGIVILVTIIVVTVHFVNKKNKSKQQRQ